MEKLVTQESQTNLLLVHYTGVHGPKHVISLLKRGSCHEVDGTVCCNDLECWIDLTTISKEDRKGEGEDQASSAIMDANNLGVPHIQAERGYGSLQILLREELRF